MGNHAAAAHDVKTNFATLTPTCVPKILDVMTRHAIPFGIFCGSVEDICAHAENYEGKPLDIRRAPEDLAFDAREQLTRDIKAHGDDRILLLVTDKPGALFRCMNVLAPGCLNHAFFGVFDAKA